MEGEKHQCGRDTLICCLSQASSQSPGPQPRPVPRLGIKPRPFSSQASTESTEPHQPELFFFFCCLKIPFSISFIVDLVVAVSQFLFVWECCYLTFSLGGFSHWVWNSRLAVIFFPHIRDTVLLCSGSHPGFCVTLTAVLWRLTLTYRPLPQLLLRFSVFSFCDISGSGFLLIYSV